MKVLLKEYSRHLGRDRSFRRHRPLGRLSDVARRPLGCDSHRQRRRYPFRLDISGDGAILRARCTTATTKNSHQASYENGTLVLNHDHYLTKITATLKDGELQGKIQMRNDQKPEGSAFSAKRYVADPAPAADAPSIAGNWVIPFESQKGEKAWRLIVKQNGAKVTAAILRVDGDTGALTGRFHDGKWQLSHFDGSRPCLMEVTPAKDGSLRCRRRVEARAGQPDRVCEASREPRDCPPG